MTVLVARHGFIAPRDLTARVCGGCGLDYARFRSGFTWRDALEMVRARPMLVPRGECRFVGPRGIRGKLGELKRRAWSEHLHACGAFAIDASDRRWGVAHGRHFITLDEADRIHLDAVAGDELDVELDGEDFVGVLDADGRLVVRAPWRDVVVPCTTVRVRSWKRRAAAFEQPVGYDDDVPF